MIKAVTILFFACALSLTACQKDEGVGERTGKKIDESVDKAKDSANKAIDSLEKAIEGTPKP